MKNFIAGVITTILIGGWVILAVVGIISVKIAILVPVGIVLGFLLALFLLWIAWNI